MLLQVVNLHFAFDMPSIKNLSSQYGTYIRPKYSQSRITGKSLFFHTSSFPPCCPSSVLTVLRDVTLRTDRNP